MEPKFILNREKISDDEIEKNKNFDELLTKFKNQSIQKARNDRSWWKKKSIKYSGIILGIAVICTVTLSQLYNSKSKTEKANDKTYTSLTNKKEVAKPERTKRTVTPVNPRLDVAYTRYIVNADKGGNVKHEGKSLIRIPQKAFVTKSGALIEGEVEILYREIHKVSEQMMCGIPMQYDSVATTYDFESAGMFDIKGEKNGETVFLKANTTLTIELASEKVGAHFNQYILDTASGNWVYLRKDVIQPLAKPSSGNKPAVPVLSESEIIKQSEIAQNEGLEKIEKNYTRELAKLPVVRQPAKPRKVSNRPNFTLEVDKNEFPELGGFSNVVFEVGDENKNYSDRYTEITWNDVSISDGPQKGMNYLLNLRKGSQTLNLIVYPCLGGTDFEKANAAFKTKMADYEKALAERQVKEEKLRTEMLARQKAYQEEVKRNKEQQLKNYIREMKAREQANAGEVSGLQGAAKVLRVFQISQFGIYNSDGPRAKNGDYRPTVTYQLNGKPFVPQMVYVMDYQDRMFYTYAYKDVSDLVFRPGIRHTVCVPVNGRLYLKQYFADDTDMALRKSRLSVDLKPLPEDVQTIEDVKRYFEI